MSTNNKLLLIIKKFSKINVAEISLSSSINELKFDSLDLLEFQMAIDNEFGIEIKIDDFLKCKTIYDISILIDNYCK